jgi:hypothetical protein
LRAAFTLCQGPVPSKSRDRERNPQINWGTYYTYRGTKKKYGEMLYKTGEITYIIRKIPIRIEEYTKTNRNTPVFSQEYGKYSGEISL